jgi:hypothetical protein
MSQDIVSVSRQSETKNVFRTHKSAYRVCDTVESESAAEAVRVQGHKVHQSANFRGL